MSIYTSTELSLKYFGPHLPLFFQFQIQCLRVGIPSGVYLISVNLLGNYHQHNQYLFPEYFLIMCFQLIPVLRVFFASEQKYAVKLLAYISQLTWISKQQKAYREKFERNEDFTFSSMLIYCHKSSIHLQKLLRLPLKHTPANN